ncbi:MAG: methylated-DNA--[protein]-cysteine S-methyltransferase [Oscillospiraceae bacterium]|nr:methylated-DNA--[protein]-cysteine S-methyltransferase [Oscillospiraceae bacterium]
MSAGYTFHWTSPLGPVTLAGEGDALTGLWFDGQKYFGEKLGPEGDLPVFRQAVQWLEVYFSGRDPGPVPPVRLRGTAFQMAVWEQLRAIPYGETTTYGAIARTVAAQRGLDSMSAQAVGSAVGRNPVSIIVPCHRVIGANGSLTGYAGGLDKKAALLALEGGTMN